MSDYFYVTTPIYYVNDKPHIGHAYTTVLADVLTRYHRLMGQRCFFLTGTDEHGQKVSRAAEKNGITPQEQCDRTVVRFQELWHKLGITHDDFIRTTEPRHKQVVTAMLADLWARGEIYRSDYEGWYCTPCERYFTERDLQEGKCPDCKRPVEHLAESNYFFRMSKYQQWLVEYIQAHPEFIQPDFRRNETLGFLRQPLGDLCISRPKSRLPWGIELPFDKDYVCYVWYDALVNYISAMGYRADEARFQQWWPVSCHLIGKDILTTHTVYWPCMLKAAGVAQPRTVFAHGWWLVGQDKMGKSLGNVVDPMALCDRYGVDPFRYFVMAEMTPGQDASFTEERFIERFNNDLADGLGNMASRVLKLAIPNFDGKVPAPGASEPLDQALQAQATALAAQMVAHVEKMTPNRGLEAVFGVVGACNRYFEQTIPWKLLKEGKRERLGTVLYTAAEALRIVSGLLYPVMPAKMGELRAALGVPADQIAPRLADLQVWGKLVPGAPLGTLPNLFPRIEKAKDAPAGSAGVPTRSTSTTGSAGVSPATTPPAAATAPASAPAAPGAPAAVGAGTVTPAAAPEGVALLDITQFGQVQLRVAKVLTAEPVPKADRILKLQIDLGTEQRQIVAGIAQFYKPEQVVGRLIVVVANLKPAKIRGLDSNGMLLAAKTAGALRLITVDGDIAPGASVG